MVVHKRMLVLANSVKKGSGRCIAGRVIVATDNSKPRIGPWLRPVSGHGEGEILPGERLYKDGRQVSVLDIAAAPLDGKVTDPCQPENWRLASSERWDDLSARYRLAKLAPLEERPANLWLQPNELTDRVTHAYMRTDSAS